MIASALQSDVKMESSSDLIKRIPSVVWISLVMIHESKKTSQSPNAALYFSQTFKKGNEKLTVGLEPTTSGLEVQCAIQLRHASLLHLLSLPISVPHLSGYSRNTDNMDKIHIKC